MPNTDDIDERVAELCFADLLAHHQRVEQLVAQRREELRAKLEHDAELIGFKLQNGKAHKTRPRRNSKDQHGDA